MPHSIALSLSSVWALQNAFIDGTQFVPSGVYTGMLDQYAREYDTLFTVHETVRTSNSSTHLTRFLFSPITLESGMAQRMNWTITIHLFMSMEAYSVH